MKTDKQDLHMEEIPTTIPVVPTVDVVVFPHMVVPLLVLDAKIINGIQEALEGDKKVLLVATKPQDSLDQDGSEPIGLSDLYEVGTVGEIIRVMQLPEGGSKVLIQGVVKARIKELNPLDMTLEADIDLIPESYDQYEPEEIESRIKRIIGLVEQLPSNNTLFSPDFPVILSQIEDPYKVGDFILSHLNLEVDYAQQLLESSSLLDLFDEIGTHLEKILASLQVEESIKSSTRDSINKSQREYYLREQLRAIQKELGDDAESDVDEFKEKIAKLDLPEEARTEARRQLNRLEKTAGDSLEATVIRNHLEWLLNLPWNKQTEDNKNITHAKEILDKEHFGLEEVKERILDYLSVKYLKEDSKAPILCLAGPPGVGKTSLGKSIAECMERTFARIALGGVHDESEIRGHRRTYVGALPGRFIQAIRKAGSMNPILMLDEIDKVGSSHKGDPSAALLEVLDPEQNDAFYDNYLGVHFDFSRVMFITTANDLSTIPGPLRDRMEIINVSGYTLEEKVEIAKNHLIPRVIETSGLKDKGVEFSAEVLVKIVKGYTREAGVRTLSKMLQKLCAKFARSLVERDAGITFTPENIEQYLGPAHDSDSQEAKSNKIGITNGLAWTPYGGEILQVEAILMPGTGKLILTGQLGDVMKESAQAAVSYARSHAKQFGIDASKFTEYDLHIHLPAGSIPKDGPSAGVTLLSSIFSVYTNRPVSGDFAMTGEINLQGSVLPIGGVKEKLLAAKQQGLPHVIFPRQNEKDINGMKVKPEGIEILFVESVDEVLDHVLLGAK